MTLYASRAVRRRRWPLRAVAALAVVLLAVAGIELGGVVARMRHDRAQVDAGQAALTRTWRQPDLVGALVAGRPAPGGPIGRMTIPGIGSWILAEGVDLATIAGAPGHFPQTAMPGQRGNASFAGHREAGMWADLDDVKPGDAVVIETRTKWFVYRVSVTRVVASTDLGEVAPVPPGMNAGRLLTLTTCWPRWAGDNPAHRLVVHAVLERTTPADQPPEEIQ